MKFTKFTVEGSGKFPIDMLRYDRAFPCIERDSGQITARGKRRVALLKVDPNRTGPTVARWGSFGWRVIDSEQW